MSCYSKILVAPSAYKGTLTADEVAHAIAAGIASVRPDAQIICAPIADGGDGTLAAIHAAVGGKVETVAVTGALGDAVEANWLQLDDLAVVELASASGIAAIAAEKLRALDAHTIGTGQVILRCLEQGLDDIVVCVGGSASTDGGAGLLCALGAKFLDGAGMPLALGGGALLQIESCDLDELARWRKVQFRVATDVTSPLLGVHGAAAIFAPQKGASVTEVALLDAGLTKYADVLERATGRCARSVAGSGAAGGTAFGLACALGAEILPGFTWLSSLMQLEAKVLACDLIITAEGCLDHQSVTGKATGELAKLCQRHGKPLWVVPARSQPELDWGCHKIDRVVETSKHGERVTAATVCAVVAAMF